MYGGMRAYLQFYQLIGTGQCRGYAAIVATYFVVNDQPFDGVSRVTDFQLACTLLGPDPTI